MPVTGGWDRLTPEGEKFFRQIDELQDKEVFVGFQAGKVADDRGVDCLLYTSPSPRDTR